MTIDDYVRNIDEDGNPTFLITDMKAFGTELLKMLCKELHVVGIPEIPILTEEEYAKLRKKNIYRYDVNDGLEDVHAHTSVFDHVLESSKIKDEHKDDPVVYGEELAHGIRYHKHTKLHPNSEPVNEFFGWAGQDATYLLLKERDAFKNMPSNSSIKGLAKMYKRSLAEKAENEKQLQKLRKKLSPLEERLEEMRNSDVNFIMSNEYCDIGLAASNLIEERNYQETKKEISKKSEINKYLNNLRIDEKSRAELKADVFEFIEIIKKEDDEKLNTYFKKIEKKEKDYDEAAVEFNKLSKRTWKLRKKGYELSQKEDKLISRVNHYQGYLVASVACPYLMSDKNLFYRTEEETRHIYFEPVLKYDWRHFDSDNLIWDRTWDKVLHEMKKRAKTTDAVANGKRVVMLRQAGFV